MARLGMVKVTSSESLPDSEVFHASYSSLKCFQYEFRPCDVKSLLSSITLVAGSLHCRASSFQGVRCHFRESALQSVDPNFSIAGVLFGRRDLHCRDILVSARESA